MQVSALVLVSSLALVAAAGRVSGAALTTASPALPQRRQLSPVTKSPMLPPGCVDCYNPGNDVADNATKSSPDEAVVTVRNGSYVGAYLASLPPNATQSGLAVTHPQDLFLGMPYAQPPVGDLRFRRPQRLASNSTPSSSSSSAPPSSWKGIRPARRYGPACLGFGGDSDYDPANFVTLFQSEDCLTLNVVRPHRNDDEGGGGASQVGTDASARGGADANATDAASSSASLPVLVFFHGGGFVMGSSADRRYNASFIVERSVAMGKPIVFVSANYRLHALGFPVGDEAQAEGAQNLGLYDQRLALEWVQENIGAFGGDPSRVAIFGESAGGASVLLQMTAYGGRDDGLFRAVMSDSGYYVTPPRSDDALSLATRRGAAAELYRSVGCDGAAYDASSSSSAARFDCLRRVPFERWAEAVGGDAKLNASQAFAPVVDADLVKLELQQSFRQNQFVRRPLLMIANTDEGISFANRTVNTTTDMVEAAFYSGILPTSSFSLPGFNRTLLDIYPYNDGRCPPYNAGEGRLAKRGTPGYGELIRRSAALFGDLRMVAARREVARIVSDAGVDVYTGRFDQVPQAASVADGVGHFVEMAYVFSQSQETQNALGTNPLDLGMARQMTTYYINFVNDLRPTQATSADASNGTPASSSNSTSQPALNSTAALDSSQNGSGNGSSTDTTTSPTAPDWPAYRRSDSWRSLRLVNAARGVRAHDGAGVSSEVALTTTGEECDTYREEAMRTLNDMRAGNWTSSSTTTTTTANYTDSPEKPRAHHADAGVRSEL